MKRMENQNLIQQMNCKCLFIKLNLERREMFFLLLLHLCLLDDCLKNHHLIIRSNKPWFSSTSSSSPSSFLSRSDGRELMVYFLTYFSLTSERGIFFYWNRSATICAFKLRVFLRAGNVEIFPRSVQKF